MPTELTLVRCLLTMALSLAFGFYRQRWGKPIGFGTFSLVAVGACGLAITAVSMQHDNPLPLLSGIVTGVGFLGAGALFRTGERVVGFTSAATIWAFAVFGLAMGLGLYALGVVVYAFVVLVHTIDHTMETRAIGAYRRRVTVTVREGTDEPTIRSTFFGDLDASLVGLRVDKREGEVHAAYVVRVPGSGASDLEGRLRQADWVTAYSID